MDFLWYLLFIPFSYVFYKLVGIMFGYITYGETGARYLKQWDEMRKGKKSRLFPFIFILLMLLTMYLVIWMLSVFLWVLMLKSKGTDGSAFMNAVGQYIFLAVIGLPLLFIAVASFFRRRLKEKADQLNDSECEPAGEVKDEEE